MYPDAVQAELQHLIATEQGDTETAARIVAEWNAAADMAARKDARMGAWIMTASGALWVGFLTIAVHLITQILP